MKSARRNVGSDSSRIAVPNECNEPRDPSTLPRSAANKCQSKPDVFLRNSLKTNTRRSQQVTTFIDVRERALQISIRQDFQVEFAVTHSKQTIRVHAIRQYFGGPSGFVVAVGLNVAPACPERIRRGPSCPERSRRETRHACSPQPRLIYIGRANDNPTRIVIPPALTQEGSENRERGTCFSLAPILHARGANDTIASTEFFTESPGPAALFNSRRRRCAHA